MIKEFKEFISRGSVIDLAIGVIVGGAFNAIVTSLVNDIIMPIVGVIIGGVNFADLKIIITEGVLNEAGVLVGEVAIKYGLFIQNIVNFLIISFSIFMVIKLLNKFNRKKKEEKVVEEVPVITTEQLLTDIKEILQKKA